MKAKKRIKTLFIICLVAALFFGLASAVGAEGGRVIARCSLFEKSFVKSVHYDLKERNLRWQVSKKAGKYPWVRARLEKDPEGAVIPETAFAKNEMPPVKEKAILATMQFVATDDRPFDLGNAALGDVAPGGLPGRRETGPVRPGQKGWQTFDHTQTLTVGKTAYLSCRSVRGCPQKLLPECGSAPIRTGASTPVRSFGSKAILKNEFWYKISPTL